MTSFEIPVQNCPHCGYRVDMTTEAFGDRTPKPNDVSICIACGKVAVFTSDMRQRLPTPEEQQTLNLVPEVIKAQITWAGVPHPKPPRKRRGSRV